MTYQLKSKNEVELKGTRSDKTNELYELFAQMTPNDVVMFYEDDDLYDHGRAKFVAFYKKTYKETPPRGMVSYVNAVDENGKRGKALTINMELGSTVNEPFAPQVMVG